MARAFRGVAALLVLLAVLNGWDPRTVTARSTSQAVTDVREFGIVGDPWRVPDWAAAVGARPSMVMEFEQWNRNRVLDTHFAAAKANGVRSFMVSWEPWVPVDPALGKQAQYADQPTYRMSAIAAGEWDDYIRRFARSVAASNMTVYLRFAHEMNGDWYPWSRDPASYVRGWRHVVSLFRAEGATNARWVFSVNASMYQAPGTWAARADLFWPGDEWVDLIGISMINFGGTQVRMLSDFAPRLALAHGQFGKDLIITEFNTAAEQRVRWLTDLRTWMTSDGTWVRGVVLSQVPSRSQAQRGAITGDLAWSVTTDPETQPVVRAMITDLTGG